MRARRHRSALAPVLLLTVAACASRATPAAATAVPKGASAGLTGSAWVLEDLGGRDVLDRVPVTLLFPEPGKASGNASCNRFSGAVTVKDDTIVFGELVTTRMACGASLDGQELEYLKALQAAERYKLDGSHLLIFSKGTKKPLKFTRAPARP